MNRFPWKSCAITVVMLAAVSGQLARAAELCASERHCRRLARQARRLLLREESALDATSRRRLNLILERSQVLATVHRSRKQLQQVLERTASSQEALVEAALSGLGIAILCDWHAEEHLQRGRLTLLLKNYTLSPYDINAVYPERRFVPQKVKRFIDHLRAYLKKRDHLMADRS